ncbi:hypothetical protein [Nakamurella aerolata]|uniref:Uncharacterized protein n=1 Tax=Nakamurella aerolata TaxID=1656892 RepID=A0A849A8D2_9ACTN|nr:hypothetical protein [Nakamurella aerolata]NNG36267.1 hypothetical protein [Nakamurella aerolata]
MARAAVIFHWAHARQPMAVLPDQVLSPMDAQRTVTISRKVIDECDRRAASSRPSAS